MGEMPMGEYSCKIFFSEINGKQNNKTNKASHLGVQRMRIEQQTSKQQCRPQDDQFLPDSNTKKKEGKSDVFSVAIETHNASAWGCCLSVPLSVQLGDDAGQSVDVAQSGQTRRPQLDLV